MRVLLDTHAFLWWVEDASQLRPRPRAVIGAPENEIFVSLASCWEMAIKVSLGKLRLKVPLERFVPEQLATNGFQLFPLQFHHVVRVARLPFHHRDPFDRIRAAQALEDDLSIVSIDPIFRRYGVQRIW